jgi:hypothetical protein
MGMKMSDSYQAMYDAVRSRISGGDISGTVERVLTECFDISWQKQHLQQEIYAVAAEMVRPSVLYRPELLQDGNAWLAMYGDLPTGCVGTGDTPAAAMADFDAAWHRKAVAPPKRAA